MQQHGAIEWVVAPAIVALVLLAVCRPAPRPNAALDEVSAPPTETGNTTPGRDAVAQTPRQTRAERPGPRLTAAPRRRRGETKQGLGDERPTNVGRGQLPAGRGEWSQPLRTLLADPRDPQLLAEFIRILDASSPGERYRLLRELGNALAQDGDEAGAGVAAVREALADAADLQVAFLGSYFRALGRVNPALAVSLAGQLESRFRMQNTQAASSVFGRVAALRAAVSGWAAADPVSAAGWVQQVASPLERPQLAIAVLESWLREEPAAAADWAVDLVRSGNVTGALAYVGVIWGSRDTGAALAYLDAMLPGAERDVLAKGLISSTARRDPQQAFALLDSITPGDNWNHAAVNLAGSLAQVDPRGTALWLRENLDNQHLVAAMGRAVQAWAKTDSAAAARFVGTLPDAALQDRLRTMVAAVLGYSNPAAAIDIMAEIRDNRTRSRALESVVTNWASRDPRAAAGWAANLDGGADKQTAYANIALQWGWQNRDQAAAWLRSLPDDPAKISAVVAFAAVHVTFPDHASLDSWRTAMVSANLSRDQVLVWLQNTELPDQTRNQILQLLR